MARTRQPLDIYDENPEAMVAYLRNYGKHFNRKMYEFAVSNMYTRAGERMKPMTKEKYDGMLSQHGVTLQNDVMYDGLYVSSMAMSDYFGSSIVDERHIALYIKDYIDDPDQVDGFVFNRFYADCVLKGIPIEWEDLL